MNNVAANKIPYHSPRIFFELPEWENDLNLLEAVRESIAVQRLFGQEALRSQFSPNPQAQQEVSEETLQHILSSGKNKDDIVADRTLSNCLAFNFANVKDAIISPKVAQSRKHVDTLIERKLLALLDSDRPLHVQNSGHFWYPPGSFMGWHTNLRTPGWRLYINYVEQPGKSFFRYRDPDTGKIVTAIDRTWNFRFFRIASEKPLWHAIYSQTDRFSLGYKVSPQPSLIDRLRRKFNRFTRA